ncbi:MAG: hypothetical protein M3P50_00475, partial [Actinomycetota bacterium]|nr:hypothetical protein [Actinomycetota bacterium]
MRTRTPKWIVGGLLLALAALAAVLTVQGDAALSRSETAAVLREQGVDKPEPDGMVAVAREEAAELQEPGDAILSRQLYGSDQLPSGDLFEQAAARTRALGRATAAQAPDVASPEWQMVGPTEIGGRVLDVAVDPEVPDQIFIATATGGVWKSTDKGETFTAAWPQDETQAIGALTMTPSGVLFAGTGETGPGGGSLTYGGTGVYRSKDRGRTWQRVGLPDSSRISRIVVDPKDERRIFVAASGPLFKAGGERGLYRSTDGGDTWTRVLEGDNETTGAVDLAIDPANPQRMLAATWDHLREPDRRRYTGTGSGVYQSTDGGDTWKRVAYPPFASSPGLGRIGLAFAPSDPKTVFAVLSGESGAGLGMHRSVDGGQTWVALPDPVVHANAVVYGWWFGRVWVDPKDPNHVFSAGLFLIESKNGGVSFEINDEPHADQHALAWDLKVPKRVYLGNDGGVYRSDDNGAKFTFAKYQPFSQLYGLDVGEQDPTRIVAGLQDNGVIRSYGARDGRWNSYGGGDGERTLINPRNQDIVYGCSQYGSCFVSKTGGDSPKDFFDDEVISTRKNWFTPIEFDPEDPRTIYTGGEIMNRSDDDAGSFRTVSPDLSNGSGRETNPLFRNFGTLTTIAPAPKRTGIIYAGTDDGNLWFTRNGGGSWTKAGDPDLPKAWVTRVEVDRANPDVAYVTYSGFRQQQDSAYLLRTTDGGKSWEDIGAGLPRAPLNDVNAIGDQLAVASDVGVFLSRDGGRSWLRLGRGLPLAPVFELRYHAPTDSLFAATFGRGVYRIAMPGRAQENAPVEA